MVLDDILELAESPEYDLRTLPFLSPFPLLILSITIPIIILIPNPIPNSHGYDPHVQVCIASKAAPPLCER